jgi:hypothetical protein
MNQNTSSPRSHSTLFSGINAVIFGLVVAMLLFLIDQISIHYGVREPQLIFDDLAGGIIVGLLIYRYERNRSKYLNERLKTIQLMNHHVRNALQTIVSSAYAHGHTQQLEEIRISVNRIQWALREILPGRVLNNYDEPENPKRSQSNDRAVG